MKIQPEKPDPQQKPMASAKGDLRQLRENSGATVAELKTFLNQLKGRSPQDMLGIVAGSQLIRAIGLSAVIVLIAGVVFTAIPFAMGAGKDKSDKVAADPAAPTAPEPAIPRPTPTPDTPPAPDLVQPDTTPPNLSKLGVNGEKKAPPNVNPLENIEDDFLKELE